MHGWIKGAIGFHASSPVKIYFIEMHVPCINEIYLGLETMSDQSWGEPPFQSNNLIQATTIYK